MYCFLFILEFVVLFLESYNLENYVMSSAFVPTKTVMLTSGSLLQLVLARLLGHHGQLKDTSIELEKVFLRSDLLTY